MEVTSSTSESTTIKPAAAATEDPLANLEANQDQGEASEARVATKLTKTKKKKGEVVTVVMLPLNRNLQCGIHEAKRLPFLTMMMAVTDDH